MSCVSPMCACVVLVLCVHVLRLFIYKSFVRVILCAFLQISDILRQLQD